MLSPQIFSLRKLKFLEISGVDGNTYHQVILVEGAPFLATELRFVCWEDFPMKCLPESFNAEKLVILELRMSRMRKLWDGVKVNIYVCFTVKIGVNLRNATLSDSVHVTCSFVFNVITESSEFKKTKSPLGHEVKGASRFIRSHKT